jgi:hypothetical protein
MIRHTGSCTGFLHKYPTRTLSIESSPSSSGSVYEKGLNQSEVMGQTYPDWRALSAVSADQSRFGVGPTVAELPGKAPRRAFQAHFTAEGVVLWRGPGCAGVAFMH